MIKELEYRMGGMSIEPDLLMNNSLPSHSCHKFIVEHSVGVVSIYVARMNRHDQIRDKYGLQKENIVGGGSCYIDPEKILKLNDYSGDYKAVPKDILQKFTELLVPELQKQGIEINGIFVDSQTSLNQFWVFRRYH